MDDDIDFEASSRKKSSARKGRRARGGDAEDVQSSVAENEPASTTQPRVAATEKPTRRVGGWGDEEEEMDVTGGAKARSGRRRGEQMEETTRFSKFDDDDGSDNDIPVIPDLEDSTMDDTGGEIAIAPSVAVNRVTSYKELDKDLQRTAQFSMLDGDVDLKLLTRYLVAEKDTVEADKVWHWEHLFTEIASELQSEWDANDPDSVAHTETAAV